MSSLEQMPADFVKTFIRHVKVLSFIGLFIFDENKIGFMKKYARLSIFNAMFIPMVVGQVIYVILGKTTGATFLEAANAVPTTCLALQDLVKMLVVFFKRNAIREVFMGMAEIWPTSLQSNENEKTLKRWLRRLKTIDDAFFTVSIVFLNIYEAAPLLKTVYNIYKDPEDFQYLYPLQLYFMSWFETHWLYGISYVYVFLTSTVTHMALYISCDFLLVTLTFNLSTLMLLLQNDLEHAVFNYDYDDKESIRALKAVVSRHQKLLWLADELSNIFGLLILAQVSFSSIIICCFGFIAVCTEGMLLDNLLASFGVVFAIWNLCWPAQLLADNSFGISEAAYRSAWYDKDVKLQRYILFIMNRAQKPSYLTALGFSNLTLANFSKILSTSWSYLSLLNKMYGEIEA